MYMHDNVAAERDVCCNILTNVCYSVVGWSRPQQGFTVLERVFIDFILLSWSVLLKSRENFGISGAQSGQAEILHVLSLLQDTISASNGTDIMIASPWYKLITEGTFFTSIGQCELIRTWSQFRKVMRLLVTFHTIDKQERPLALLDYII